MKKIWIAAFLVLAFCAFASSPASAHDYDCNDSEHPLRYIAYAVHPVGVAVEFAIFRPIHWVVSRPHLNILFGHDPREDDTYFEWQNR